eukprot:13953-Pelagococcus_subviridis.AAC.1
MVRFHDRQPLGVETKSAARVFLRQVHDLHEVATRQALIQREKLRDPAAVVTHHRRELDVQMRAEPIRRFERVKQRLPGRRPQRVRSELVGEKLLFANQVVHLSVPRDASGPIVRQEDVHVLLQHGEPLDVELADVVRGLHVVSGVRRALVVPFPVVPALEDAAECRSIQNKFT